MWIETRISMLFEEEVNMGLFDKKYCDICGGKIGLLGNRKLDDGNHCKECSKNLSPFFNERRHSTVNDIKDQLDYREANKAEVSNFHPTKTLGAGSMKILLDEDAGKFIVTSSRRWQDANPDVMDFSQVTGCETEIDENKNEIKRKTTDGKEVSYTPPRYKYSYDFFVKIYVNSPWFDEIKFRVNSSSDIERKGSVEYREAEKIASEIRSALTKVRQTVRDDIAAANAPKIAQNCPLCGATTIPDENGCCEFCGGALNV